ncbi:MAG: alpha-glucan family phosphorylase [Nitrospiraceae bacterium]|nr:alpha-glucan family phosphorylase [Nitrospiraceae bacterium]
MSDNLTLGGLACSFLPFDIEGFGSLAELALDMRWSWNRSADVIWKRLDPVLWDLTTNPWVMLQAVSQDRLRSLLADPAFRKKVDACLKAKREAESAPAWFQREHPGGPLESVAYFSMEFMLSEALPIYSGGLGNVAGDQLKAASDMGVPVTGVGLLYQRGYFRQVIDRSGSQQALFPYNDPSGLPIVPLREQNGEWLRLKIAFPGCLVWLRTWQVQVGRIKLYLLDTNDPANYPTHRGITSELYPAGLELRLMQEIVLGIGGWKLLEAIGLRPEVCHLNEGHPAFAVLERARSFMKQTGSTFKAALIATRAGNIFTTHTPVAAGFDRYPPHLIEQYLGAYATNRLGITLEELLALGRQDPADSAEFFNMAYLAARGSWAINGVSQLHGEVSRRIFQPIFPRWPASEVPVGHVTNGVHMSTWDSAEADAFWTETCGKERWLGSTEDIERKMSTVPDSRIWQFRQAVRANLVEYVRKRLIRQLSVSGAPPDEIENVKHVLDPEMLTLGFARRFTSYKRPNLLLYDPDRLLQILTNPARPIQLLIAGKAHPADLAGQAMIRQWMSFIGKPGARSHVVFLSDYDMQLTSRLMHGVDVWVNTPRRPWEACGTSGMKILVNGGLNLSELDGWWAEAYTPAAGWALGDGKEHGPEWDAVEAEALYRLLEQTVATEFYSRGKDEIPPAWVLRIRQSMSRLTPQFSATRTVAEYTERYYIPSALAYRQRTAEKSAPGADIAARLDRLHEGWSGLRFGEVKVGTGPDWHAFEVRVHLNGLDPGMICLELYAEGDGRGPFRREMEPDTVRPGRQGAYVYRARVPNSRPAADYTARIRPRLPGASLPLESSLILWQR